MHFRAVLFAFAIVTIAICNAAPHSLREKLQYRITQDLNPSDASTLQTTGQVTDDISGDSSNSSDLSEFESSENVPFRRDMVSAVAGNINILIEYKSPDDTNGFVDFAKAVAHGIYDDRRSFTKPSTQIQESGDPTTCGKTCIKKRSAMPATTEELASLVEHCGKTCILKRTVKSFLTARGEDQVEYCGKACILKRTIKSFFTARGEDQAEYCGKACILKRTVISSFTVRGEDQVEYCGKACILKRAEEDSMKMEVRDGPEVIQI
ncbi:hypothetical protein MMC14_010015 [Varicellaria rhodocarpa]|nr:hypothetical protein [Varicellaria rhodocarpa]